MPTPMALPSGDGYWLWPDGSELLWNGEPDVSYDLFDLTYRVARELNILIEGVATGGSTSTLVDANQLTQSNDYWNNGTLWVIRDAGGASAAPEGEYAVVSDFDAGTDTATLQANLTAAIAAGDRYALCRKIGDRPWLNVLIQYINSAIQALGPVPYTDLTSLDTASNQTEHTLPIAANQKLLQVFIQRKLNDANDNQWSEILNWSIQPSDPGVADTIILPYQFTAGYDIKLVYLAPHPELYTVSAALSEHVPVERVVYPAVRDCFVYMKQTFGMYTKYDDEIERWTQKAEMIKMTKPIKVPQRAGRVGDLGPQERIVPYDQPNKVYL